MRRRKTVERSTLPQRMAGYETAIAALQQAAGTERERHDPDAPEAGDNPSRNAAKDIAAAGDKVLQEGRKMAKQAAEAAEQGMENLEKMVKQPGAKKSAPAAKKAPAKKAARKTTRRR